MAEFTVVTKERHANLTWQRPANYLFAAGDPVAALVAQEVPRALLCMALGFMENEGTLTPVAVQGLKQGQNKFVARDGRWLGDYVPAVYRAYPFKLAFNQEGSEVLCVEETIGQVGESRKGEPFFTPDGAPAQSVTEAFNQLMLIEKDRKKTQKSCEALTRHQLLEPWPLRLQDGAELLEASGLFRVAEAKLYALDPPALAEIRDSGALMIAFGQLFSMQQVHQLGKLGTEQRQTSQAAPALKIFDENGIISFGNI